MKIHISSFFVETSCFHGCVIGFDFRRAREKRKWFGNLSTVIPKLNCGVKAKKERPRRAHSKNFDAYSPQPPSRNIRAASDIGLMSTPDCLFRNSGACGLPYGKSPQL